MNNYFISMLVWYFQAFVLLLEMTVYRQEEGEREDKYMQQRTSGQI